MEITWILLIVIIIQLGFIYNRVWKLAMHFTKKY